MDNLDRINEILQCVGRLWNECPVEHEHVRDDLQTIVDNIEKIEEELLDLWRLFNNLDASDLIDREALKEKIYIDRDRCDDLMSFLSSVLLRIEDAPAIKPDVSNENEEDQSDG